MATLQNNTQRDIHLILFSVVNNQTGEGKHTEYILPQKLYDPQDLSKIKKMEDGTVCDGRREIPDEFLVEARKNKAVNAWFENGELSLASGSAPKAILRESGYDGTLSLGVQAVIDVTNAQLVVKGKSK